MTASQIPLDQPVGPAPAPAPTLEEPREDRRRRRRAILLLLLLGFLIFLIGLTIWYLLFRQPITPTIPVIPDASLPHYSTSIYNVKRPTGIAVNAAGDRIYVTEAGTESGILLFDGAGNLLSRFQSPEGATHVPVYLAIDPLSQDVYVTDRMAAAIYVYDADGRLKHQYQPAQAIAGWQPLGVAFDPAGDLYVTDLSASPQQVEVFDRQGRLVRSIGADSHLSFPNGVALDAAGNVYVTDSNNGRLIVFDKAGTQIAQVGRGVGEGNLGLPRGVAITGDRVFIADATGQGVFAFRPLASGEARPSYVGFLGGQGVADGQFQYPNGIAADGRGRIYVADSFNDRVQVWSY